MWRHHKVRGLCLVAALAAGCGDDDGVTPRPDAAEPRPDGGAGPDGGGELPTTPPTAVRLVTGDGFKSPTDAVASPDGSTFYFAAFTEDTPTEAAIFKVDSDGGAPSALHTGDPLNYVTGLVLSCDGATLFMADMGGGDDGAVLSMPAGGGEPTPLDINGLGVPSSLAISADCDTLYISGRNQAGQGAVFTVALDGGSADVLAEGDPLVSPTGIYVDSADVAWVMDHLGGEGQTGVLFSIPASGTARAEVEGLTLGTPGGVSLVAGGGTAVIASRDPVTGAGQLLSLEIESGDSEVLAAPEMIDPSGLRTARGAGIFAVADSEGDAIFAAE